MSLLAKWRRRFKNGEGKLWRKVIWAFHDTLHSWSAIPAKLSSPCLWSRVVKTDSVVRNSGVELTSCCRLAVRNGRNTWFWLDCWAGPVPLGVRFPKLFFLERSMGCVIADRLYMLQGWICGA